MRLRFVTPGFPDPVEPSRRVSAAALHELEVPTGLPFVIRDDGTVEEALQSYFRAMPLALNLSSANSWRGYARDIVSFAAFLASTASLEP